jgi:hypothetical protein
MAIMNWADEYQDMIPPSADHATHNKIVASETRKLQAARQSIRSGAQTETLKGLGSSMLDETFREVTRGGITWQNH